MQNFNDWPYACGWHGNTHPLTDHPQLARVCADHGRQKSLITRSGTHRALCVGTAIEACVGDWVLADTDGEEPGVIYEVLERRNVISRKAAGHGGEQVFASNVDVALLVTAHGQDFSVRRLERYLATAHQSRVRPLIVMTKADTCTDRSRWDDALAALAPAGVAVHWTSAVDGCGIDALQADWLATDTVIALGSSGVGKSTLLNRLIGTQVAETVPVRDGDEKGRHTTSHRQLWKLRHGCYIDSPGIRELGLWVDDDALGATFPDLDALARHCRFSDCAHGSEPGCAIRAAVADGSQDAGRVASWLKLRDEAARTRRRSDKVERRKAERAQGKLYRSVIAERNRRRR